MQVFLRRGGRDSFAAEKSFMYGQSVTNQVINDLQSCIVCGIIKLKYNVVHETLKNRSILVSAKKVVPGLVD